jgi:DNA-binding transcriptional MocR family regulator
VYTSERVAGDIAALLTGSGPCQYFFSPYKGDKFLRQKLVAFLGTKGVKASSGEIQILSETNQALDFIVTLLVKPGDSVVMEEPVHPDMYRVMELAGAKILTVPVDGNGMNCEVLESLLTQTRPRLIFVNSSYHDPTGNILSIERRKKIVALSNRYRVPIVEEDAASELVYDGDKPADQGLRHGGKCYLHLFVLAHVHPGAEPCLRHGQPRSDPRTELPRLRAADGLGLDDAKAPRHVP